MSFADWGIDLALMFAGFCGGTCYVFFVLKRITPMEAVGAVVGGALTANYLGPLVAKMLGWNPPAGAFVTGVAAMALCQAVIEAAGRWRFGATLGKGD